MTPEQAVTEAFRAASRRVGLGVADRRSENYQALLIQTSEHLDGAAKAWTSIAQARPDTVEQDLEPIQLHAFVQILQATISCLLALAYFPYLRAIDGRRVTERLN